jgi:antitoxin component YwqK of YwqJK toxin-antitoxin module
MKHIRAPILLMVFLFPSLALGEEVIFDDLVYQEGVFYQKKSTDVPFSGKVTKGGQQWTFKDGKAEGPYVSYHDNGELSSKGTYKNGERDGPWVTYHISGQLMIKETLKNGEREGPWEYYFVNGRLREKGTYRNGKREGPWIDYHKNGTVDEEKTGTYRNGVKVD